MPITLTYDFKKRPAPNTNDHLYLSNAFERFNWKRVGGSVLVYDRVPEDWLNNVVPALMLFRSYMKKHAIDVDTFTIHVHSLSAGASPSLDLALKNVPGQASVKTINAFIDGCTKAVPG